jgi:hypothetical protein
MENILHLKYFFVIFFKLWEVRNLMKYPNFFNSKKHPFLKATLKAPITKFKKYKILIICIFSMQVWEKLKRFCGLKIFFMIIWDETKLNKVERRQLTVVLNLNHFPRFYCFKYSEAIMMVMIKIKMFF